MTYPCCLGDQYTSLGTKLWHPKNTFQVCFFPLYFIKKYADVAINDFTKHLLKELFWNGLEGNNADKKKNKKKICQNKREIVCLQKCFHSFRYIIDHIDVSFFFLNSLLVRSHSTCSHSLNDANSLHYFMWFLLYTVLAASFHLRLLCSSHKFITIKIFSLNVWIFKNFCRRVLHNAFVDSMHLSVCQKKSGYVTV